ncbi:hypothetical protein D9757_004701 [Collybiopsis confluens]|uniref:Uncharacterized protein n=1 Tax=Collybiopsis confluens TaxID=2823264 RepID=A0A8H5HRX0_9AGAR|nr:hypothetical protein D9757_004701 [Collybiopsis confluens]
MFLPVFLLIAATVMVSFFLGCLGMHDWSFIAGQPPICSNSYIAVLFLSIAINFIATMLIAIKAWMHYRLLLSAPINKKTRGIKILVLLFESGLIYLLIWGAKSASAFGTLSSTTGGQFTTTMLNVMGNQVVGLYPTLLLVLVHMQRSTLDADLESSIDWRRSSAGRVKLSDKYQTTGERIVFASPLETFGTV